jgi:hypothetical protein
MYKGGSGAGGFVAWAVAGGQYNRRAGAAATAEATLGRAGGGVGGGGG